MESKHTPGPWIADIDGDCVYINDDYSKKICDIRGWGWLSKLGNTKAIATQKANCRLIAAAPDLLKELQHLVKIMEPLEKECALNIPGLATLNGARSAIKKAI